MTLWTPSSTAPHVRLLAHLGPVTALSVDPSSGGRYLATGGMDGRVKVIYRFSRSGPGPNGIVDQVWDSRNYASPVREWSPRAGAASALEWSQRGVLAIASGGTVNVRYAQSFVHEIFIALRYRRTQPRRSSRDTRRLCSHRCI